MKLVAMRFAQLYVLLSSAAAVLPAHAAEPIGRLFHTPDERAALDRLRDGSSARQTVDSVTLNGLVRASSGRSIAWINGEARRPEEVDQVAGVRPGSPEMTIRLQSGAQVGLKAGQTADMRKGTVQDDLVSPPDPAAGRAR